MKKITCLLCRISCLFVAACNTVDAPYNEADFAQGGVDAPLYNERTATFMQADNQYANINSIKPKTEVEIEINHTKWDTAQSTIRWQEYRGTMVRVEILLGNTDMREMRLRLYQGADGMDIDGDNHTVLNRVADFEMKKVCGRNADSIVIIYDQPAFDTMRPTPYFDYRIEAEGSTMREYGFRCVYKDL